MHTDIFIIEIDFSQQHNHRNDHKNLSITTFKFFLEFFEFLAETFQYIREVDQLIAFFFIQKINLPFFPILLIIHQHIDQVFVIS